MCENNSEIKVYIVLIVECFAMWKKFFIFCNIIIIITMHDNFSQFNYTRMYEWSQWLQFIKNASAFLIARFARIRAVNSFRINFVLYKEA